MSKFVKNIAARVIVCTVLGIGGVAVVSSMAMAETASTATDSTPTLTPSPTPTPTPPTTDNTPWG
ncbi:hypothetical protein OG589_16155 [Sphaerisporangium sp. NBC_01403]|uniref:hypothetical protein n=1 Tax=Sphaerisporangium TaxID=321315 RepID=UPI0032445862